MVKKLIVFSILTAACLNTANTRAADFHSPRTAGLGGAGHAGPILNDALFLNPSFSALIPSQSFAFNYVKADTGNILNTGVLDGQSELFSAGAAYTRRADSRFIHIGAGRALMRELGIGLGGKFMLSGNGKPSGRDMTFSMSGIPSETLQLAFIIDNLLESDAARARGLEREFIAGIKYNWDKIFLLYFDPHYIPQRETKYGYSVGAEFVAMQDLYLRVGKFKDSYVPHQGGYGRGLGIGFGWIAPKISFDYAFQKVTLPIKGNAHVFGTTIFF